MGPHPSALSRGRVRRPTSTASWAAATALAAVVVALVLVGTRGGLDLPPDGATYVGVAENLADGRGPTSPFPAAIDPYGPRQALGFDRSVPVLGWPPLYPAALAPGVVLGAEATTVARVVGALSAGVLVAATAMVTARLVGRGTRAAPWAGTAAAVVVAAQPWFARLHDIVASEPLYLALVVVALALGAHGLAQERRAVPPSLVAAFTVAAVASGVRFIGVTLVVALAAGVVLVGTGRLRRRLVLGAGLGAAALAPGLAWSWWVGSTADASLRQLAWHPPGRGQWEGMATAVLAWAVPTTAPTAGRVVALALASAAVVAAAAGWRRTLRSTGTGTEAGRGAGAGTGTEAGRGIEAGRGTGAGTGTEAGRGTGAETRAATPPGRSTTFAGAWLALVGLSSLGYLAMLVATHAVADRMVPFNGRLLLPLLAPLAATVVAGGVRWWRSTGTRSAAPTRGRLLAGAAAVVVVVLVAGQSGDWRDLLDDGRLGPTGDATTTASADYLRHLDVPVVAANDPALVWRLTDAQVIGLPHAVRDASGLAEPAVADELSELGDVLEETGGVAVVHRGSAFANPGIVGVDRLVGEAGLEVVATFEDAVVLAPPGPVSDRLRLR